MQSGVGSVGSLEDGKVPYARTTIQSTRPFPLRLLSFLLLFLVVVSMYSFLSLYMSLFLKIQNVIPVVQSRIQPCVQEPRILEKWIRPPSYLIHTMTDSELFWRASFIPRIKEYPFKRTPKIAFMFLTRGPLPMAPLWDKFFKGNEKLYSIYIHSSPSYHPDFPTSSAFYGRQIPSQDTEWGMMSLCDGERRLLANALLDISNECFIGAFDEPGQYGRGRYNEKMSPEVNLTEWRKGSQWFELSRKLAVDIVQDSVYYPKFKQFCRALCYVDEHYFQTMLSIQSSHLLANRSLTWVVWPRHKPHPATFGKADINENFFKKISEGKPCTYNNQLTSLCFLFARKFAPSSLEPLLEHSSEYLGF
ncbi:uncharacterized protein LOC111375408 [Olea europaea var. sylvestris]|uniref:uncharacterized protein LOC111375408 n=1 Tax=Olea europaea var. sylvestris TaxID=158386 RepID=UPI000C1D4823|nr:uncharacterized protein LOC111375408 [Olea europaea var. sylvestris]